MPTKLLNAKPIKPAAKFVVPDVQFVPIESVQFWKSNPWVHDNSVPRLAELLAIHGQVSPVIVWRKNMTIYKGNHTKKALMYIATNMEKVAKATGQTVVELLGKVNPELIKVEFRDFPSETAANAYGISDNNSSMGGEYNDAVLRQLLMSNEEYMTSNRTGFTEKELKQFKLTAAENMEKLANINIQGETAEMGAFCILTFDSEDILAQFKAATGMNKNERSLPYNKLMEVMGQ